MKYEYKIIDYTEQESWPSERELNDMGDLRWQLCGIRTLHPNQEGIVRHRFYFMREIQEE